MGFKIPQACSAGGANPSPTHINLYFSAALRRGGLHARPVLGRFIPCLEREGMNVRLRLAKSPPQRILLFANFMGTRVALPLPASCPFLNPQFPLNQLLHPFLDRGILLSHFYAQGLMSRNGYPHNNRPAGPAVIRFGVLLFQDSSPLNNYYLRFIYIIDKYLSRKKVKHSSFFHPGQWTDSGTGNRAVGMKNDLLSGNSGEILQVVSFGQ